MAGSTGERKIMHSVVRVACVEPLPDGWRRVPTIPHSSSIPFHSVVPGRHSSLSLSFSARTQMSLTSSSSSLFLRFPRYKSDPSDAGQFVARAWTQSPVSTQSLCVILDSVGMSDPLKGQHLILDQLWFTVLFPRIERLGRKKMWRIGKCQQCGWFLNCVVEVLEDWNNSRWSEKYFKDIFRKIVQLKLCKNRSSFNS